MIDNQKVDGTNHFSAAACVEPVPCATHARENKLMPFQSTPSFDFNSELPIFHEWSRKPTLLNALNSAVQTVLKSELYILLDSNLKVYIFFEFLLCTSIEYRDEQMRRQ